MKSQASKQGLVWGGLLILLGVMSLLDTFADLGAWIWVAVLTLAGLGVYAIYTTDRTQKWVLIVSYVLLVVAGLVTLITLNILRDEAIATFVLSAIALPFLVAYFRDRSQAGFLIPAYVLFAVGVMVGLIGAGILDDLLIPAYVLFAVAIPFLVAFMVDRRKWGMLIPGGITAIVGFAFLIAEATVEYLLPVVLILAGAWILLRQFMDKESDKVVSGTDKPSMT